MKYLISSNPNSGYNTLEEAFNKRDYTKGEMHIVIASPLTLHQIKVGVHTLNYGYDGHFDKTFVETEDGLIELEGKKTETEVATWFEEGMGDVY